MMSWCDSTFIYKKKESFFKFTLDITSTKKEKKIV